MSGKNSRSWKKLRWGNLATLEYGKGIRGYQNADGAYPVYGTNGMIGWHSEPLCKEPGIIVGRKGAYREVHFSDRPFFVIDTAFYLKPKTDFNIKWAYYQLKNFDINTLDSGSAIPSTSREAFYQIPVDLPPHSIQIKIVSTLSAYDDLIENNTRRIEILEEMARLIYREWFVKFKFPGHGKGKMVDSPLGKIPEGWEIRKLKEITSKIGSGATPRGGKEAYKSEGISLIRSLNIYDYQFKYDNLAFIDDNQAVKLDNVRVAKYDVLLNITGASVARCCMVPSDILPARVNQHVTIIRANKEGDPFYILDTINSETRKQQLLTLAQGGATRQALTKDTISNLDILIPYSAVLEKYSNISGSLHELRQTLKNKNQNLRQTRDLLLPKLISGEVDVEELDITTGELDHAGVTA